MYFVYRLIHFTNYLEKLAIKLQILELIVCVVRFRDSCYKNNYSFYYFTDCVKY